MTLRNRLVEGEHAGARFFKGVAARAPPSQNYHYFLCASCPPGLEDQGGVSGAISRQELNILIFEHT